MYMWFHVRLDQKILKGLLLTVPISHFFKIEKLQLNVPNFFLIFALKTFWKVDSIADSIRDIQRLESGDNKPGENTWKILNENMQDLKDMLSAETKFRVKTRLLAKGSFFNYTDNSLPIVDHLPHTA